MSELDMKEFTMEEVSRHATPEDCWVIIGNMSNGGPKVYDVSRYLDDHPGGAEVLLEVGGQDADEFFEDIGHSKDARQELKKHYIGTLKIDAGERARRKLEAEFAAKKKKGAGGLNAFVFFVAMVAILIGYYKTEMFGLFKNKLV